MANVNAHTVIEQVGGDRVRSPQPRVFVSFAPADGAFAQVYVAGLRASGIAVWWDQALLAGGGATWPEVQQALDGCDAYVLVQSPAALASERVNAEIDYALDRALQGRLRVFLPVMAYPCPTPLLLGRYKRIEGPRGGAVSVTEAVTRTQQTLRDPQVAQPVSYQTADRGSGSGPRPTARALVFRATLLATIAAILLGGSVGAYRIWVSLPLPGHTFTGLEGGASLGRVRMVSPTDGWAVGERGTILRYAGGEWRWQSSPTTHDLLDLALLPGGAEGWAVGTGGTVLHDVNGSWSLLPIPTTIDLNAVAAIAPGTVWVAGADDNTNGLWLWQYTNGTWTHALVNNSYQEVADHFNAFSVLSPNDVWGVTYDGSLAHYAAGRWTVLTAPAFLMLYAVWAVSDTEVWAAGFGKLNTGIGQGGIVFRFDGHVAHFAYTQSYVSFFDIAVVGSEVWAVGGATPGFGPITIVRGGVGTSWKTITGDAHVALGGGISSAGAASISMVAPDEGWSVGNSGSIFHISGDSWTIYNQQ